MDIILSAAQHHSSMSKEHPSTKPLLLRAVEARSKDAGRMVARIDPQHMDALGVEAGDVISVAAEREALARVLPCFPADRGKSIIQVDGMIRQNAGAPISEEVRVEAKVLEVARKVTLEPMGYHHMLQNAPRHEYLRSLMEGLPLATGHHLRVKLLGSSRIEFVVREVLPGAQGLIDGTTRIELHQAARSRKASGGISYEDVGGLREQVRQIREMIELPLKYPSIFQNLGIDAPKGVLLSGPPGTGKTLIARAVAHETDVHFTSVSGPEIMGKMYGESEGRIRKIFEEAGRNAPSIVFLDELDSIAPKRDDIGGEKQVERRVVAQLLSLLDGLENRGQVIVIGGTNLPDAIDPALRRPGRFDREIRIPIPDRFAREEILGVHTRDMPLDEEVSLSELAAHTHGYVGADLEALCREAALACLRDIMPSINFDDEQLPMETIRKLRVEMGHFREAIKRIEPSAIRQFFVEVPEVKWQNVGGLGPVKEELREALEWPLKHEDLFRQAGVRAPKGILLYGPPGTGKTLLAKAAASQTGVNFISVKGPELLSRFVGESERALRQVFLTAKQAAPTLIFFDEIDALGPRRSGSSDNQASTRLLSQFLTEMDGVEELQDVLVLGATNRLDMLDPALVRSGRFDMLLEVPPPPLEARREILHIHTQGQPLHEDVDLDKLAAETEGMVGADIAFLCRKAALLAIGDQVRQAHYDIERFQVAMVHYRQALATLHQRTTRETDL